MNRKLKLALMGAGIAVPVLATATAFGAGPNMAKNGDFAQGTAHWQEPANLADSMQMSAGAGGTLAVTITHDTQDGHGYAAAAVQCIKNIKPDTQYTYEADAFMPAGQGRHGSANLFAFGYDGPDCNGYSPGSPSSQDLSQPNGWMHLEDSFVPPAGSKSVAFYLRVHMQDTSAGEDESADLTVFFDNASFTEQGPATEDPVGWPEYQGPPAPQMPQDPDIEIPGPLGQPPAPQPPTPTPPAPPSQPPAPDQPAPQQPQVPSAPPADEPAPDPAPASSNTGGDEPPATTNAQTASDAPLPPSTGTGMARDGRQTILPMAAVALLIAGLSSGLATALERRQRRRR